MLREAQRAGERERRTKPMEILAGENAMLSTAGISLSKNGITVAVKPNWEGPEELAFLEEIGLE